MVGAGECRAARIAAGLLRRHGASALDRARLRRGEAAAAGRIERADLYSAVCTVLIDRNGTFSRSRRLVSWEVRLAARS